MSLSSSFDKRVRKDVSPHPPIIPGLTDLDSFPVLDCISLESYVVSFLPTLQPNISDAENFQQLILWRM